MVQAGLYGAWAWAWEEAGFRCAEDPDLILRVSAGAEALLLHKNEKVTTDLRYARDGILITGIDTLTGISASDRYGSAPDHFTARMRELGADPEANDFGPLGSGLFYRLAEDLGVGLPHEDLMNSKLSGRPRRSQ